MDWITVTGVRPYDGRYELDITNAPLTTREWGWVKRHAGYLPVTIGDDGFTDPELISVLAVIALRRAGVIDTKDVAAVYDRIADAPFGSTIALELNASEEDDAGPPENSSSNGSSAGAASPTSSESSEPLPSPTGPPGSATSESGLPTLVS